MEGYVRNIEKAARQNRTFRTVLYTAKNCQLVVMSLKPGEDIGVEVHKLDQFFRVEEGEGKAVLDGIEHRIKAGFAILVPAGTRHNIINGSSSPIKLYTLRHARQRLGIENAHLDMKVAKLNDGEPPSKAFGRNGESDPCPPHGDGPLLARH